MDQKFLYSVRMHASAGSRHISGAERIVSYEHIDDVVRQLTARAKGRQCTPEQITIKIDCIEGLPLRTLTALDVVTMTVPDMSTGRSLASQVLQAAGVSPMAVEAAVHHLRKGAALSGGNMRGAMIVNSRSGERLEPDRERGVRASRFDWTDEALLKIQQSLESIGLSHHRTLDALALATKVAHAPGMVAELCWSDDPDYTAGYVASLRTGYVRFPLLKQLGDTRGGRAFFVDRDSLDMDGLVDYLEKEPVLISEIGSFSNAMSMTEIQSCLNKALR